MSDPAARVLELLSLLQTHVPRKASELADRLGVDERTVRRDVDRLRKLGYPVDAETGVAGGYRLAVGAHLPPLVVNDEEAVALVIGLRSAASSPIEGSEAAAVGLLTKLDRVLPDAVRRRVSTLSSNVDVMAGTSPGPTIEVSALTRLSQACDVSEEVRFAYQRRDGEASDRLVRPHTLVTSGRRWYLVAWDVRRDDWRTFRLDRMSDVRLAGVRFTAMDLPGASAADFVRASIQAMPALFEIVLEASGNVDDLGAIAGRFGPQAEVLPSGHLRLRLHSDSLEWLSALVAMVAAHCDLTIIEAPEELGPLLSAAGRRLAEATGD